MSQNANMTVRTAPTSLWFFVKAFPLVFWYGNIIPHIDGRRRVDDTLTDDRNPGCQSVSVLGKLKACFDCPCCYSYRGSRTRGLEHDQIGSVSKANGCACIPNFSHPTLTCKPLFKRKLPTHVRNHSTGIRRARADYRGSLHKRLL